MFLACFVATNEFWTNIWLIFADTKHKIAPIMIYI